MNLLWAGASASMLIVALISLRLMLMKRLPKGFFAALWWIPLVRLLLPLELPSIGSLVQQSTSAWKSVQAAPLGTALRTPVQGGIRVMLEPVAQEMERQTVAAHGIPLWQLLWALGTVLVLAYVIINTVRGYRKFAIALPEQNPRVAQWLLAQRIHRRVQVRQSDRIEAPMAYGILRPVILLPRGFADCEDMALFPVLSHEMAHICRLDSLTKILQWVALALHWWNPLVWAMLLLCGRDMELACDQRALMECSGEGRANFAHTLLALSQERQMQWMMPYALSFSKYALEERIQQMMKPKRISVVAILIAVLVTLVAVGMANTTEPKEMNEWLAQAQQKILETQLIDRSTASDEELMGLEGKEFDGVMMYKTAFDEVWRTYEELLADQEDGYYIYTYEERRKYLESSMAHMQALADFGAHFWLLDKGWMEDPQEALQIPREAYRQWLAGIQNGRELLYVALEDGQVENEWQVIEETYAEVRGSTLPRVVIQISPVTFLFFDDYPTKNQLRESLLESCMDSVHYGVLTQEQVNDILSADFLY